MISYTQSHNLILFNVLIGQRCIAGHPEQCRNLVGLLSSNVNLAGLVAPHFTPSTSDPSSSSVDAFLDSYRLVTALSKHDSDLILVLLTKVRGKQNFFFKNIFLINNQFFK